MIKDHSKPMTNENISKVTENENSSNDFQFFLDTDNLFDERLQFLPSF